MPLNELTSLYAAFRADDTRVEIVPGLDYRGTLPTACSGTVGPFISGVPTTVPLWMALVLQQRSLAKIAPPEWLNIANLTEILKYEKKEPNLFDDKSRLPTNYYEIAKRLSPSLEEHSNAVNLLIQDLLEVRLDKLRQQFQTLLKGVSDSDLMVAVNGIGSQELAILQHFVVTALNDQHALAQRRTIIIEAPALTTEDRFPTEASDAPTVRRSKVPLRRFRKTTS